MMIAVVGSGGKTSLIKELAAKYRAEGKSVFVTTTTHMFAEEDTLCTDDAASIITCLKQTGYVMAGLAEGEKIKALSHCSRHNICRRRTCLPRCRRHQLLHGRAALCCKDRRGQGLYI